MKEVERSTLPHLCKTPLQLNYPCGAVFTHFAKNCKKTLLHRESGSTPPRGDTHTCPEKTPLFLAPSRDNLVQTTKKKLAECFFSTKGGKKRPKCKLVGKKNFKASSFIFHHRQSEPKNIFAFLAFWPGKNLHFEQYFAE